MNPNLYNIVNKLRVKDLDGISITSPYKRDFINYIDDIDPLANRIGSINCIASTSKKLIGHNTDYYGFQCMLENNNLILDNKKIVVLGAGGASAAICAYLIDSNIRFTIVNRNPININKMIDRIKMNTDHIYISNSFEVDKCDLIINCTTANADIEKTFNFCINTFLDNKHIIDLNYTNFSEHSSNQNYINGIDMLLYQGIRSNEIWLQKDLEEKIDAWSTIAESSLDLERLKNLFLRSNYFIKI